VLTHRLQRTLGVETAAVLGGSMDPQVPTPAANPTWNTFESLKVHDSSVQPPLEIDRNQNNDRVFAGPGYQGSGQDPDHDWLEEYPRTHLLGDGTLFVSGPAPVSARISPESPPSLPTGTWFQQWNTTTGQPGPASQHRHYGSSVLYPNLGGLTDVVVRLCGMSGTFTSRTVEACIATGPLGGNWGQQPSLGISRWQQNAVILPDGSIFVVGGVRVDATGSTYVWTPELYRNGVWVQQPNHVSPRDYHSTAVLLPDGRVLCGGGNNRTIDYEIFSPPYMSGDPLPIPPMNVQIANAPIVNGTYQLVHQTGGYRLTCTFGGALGPSLQKAVLIAPGSVTHHSDMHQRYFEMAVTQVSPTELQFTTPAETQTPRGYYMLWAVANGGIPSHAIWVMFT